MSEVELHIVVPANATMAEIERDILMYHIYETDSYMRDIAKILGMDYRTIYKKVKDYGIPKRTVARTYCIRKRASESKRIGEQDGVCRTTHG